MMIWKQLSYFDLYIGLDPLLSFIITFQHCHSFLGLFVVIVVIVTGSDLIVRKCHYLLCSIECCHDVSFYHLIAYRHSDIVILAFQLYFDYFLIVVLVNSLNTLVLDIRVSQMKLFYLLELHILCFTLSKF